MADDRTPRTASLTERPPDDDLPPPRKRGDRADGRPGVPPDHELAAARESSERRADQEPRPRMT